MYYSPCKDVQACNYRSETSEGDKTETPLKNHLPSKHRDTLCVPQVGAGGSFVCCSGFGLPSHKCASWREGTGRTILLKPLFVTDLRLQWNPKAFCRLNISLLRYYSVYHQWRAEGANPQHSPCTVKKLIRCRESETYCQIPATLFQLLL